MEKSITKEDRSEDSKKSQKKDIRRMKSIPEQSYNELLEYLTTKPYREVAPHINALGRALNTNVEVVPD